MALTIPCDPTSTHYDLQVTLDGAVYTLEFRWNTRDAAWYMDVKTAAGDPVVSGRRIVIDFPLGQRSRDPRRPPGTFVALDSSGKGAEPGIGDLGARVQLIYFEASEVPNGIG